MKPRTIDDYISLACAIGLFCLLASLAGCGGGDPLPEHCANLGPYPPGVTAPECEPAALCPADDLECDGGQQ